MGSDVKGKSTRKYNDAYNTQIMCVDTTLARKGVAAVFNEAFVDSGKVISFDKYGYKFGTRKYTSEYTGGREKELDIDIEDALLVDKDEQTTNGDDAIILSAADEENIVHVDIEVGSSRMLRSNVFRYFSYAIATGEQITRDYRQFPYQCALVLHLQSDNDPSVLRLKAGLAATEPSRLIVDYQIPIVHLSPTVIGTVFEPYYWQEMMAHSKNRSREEGV